MSAPDALTLAADFPAATREQWRTLVDGVLKGAPFEKLIGKTADGLAIQPLYERAQGALPIAGRPAAAPWQIMQRIDHPDAKQANVQALHDLENGATALSLVFAGSVGARGFGLNGGAETLRAVLDGVMLDAGIGLELQLSPQTRDAATHLVSLLAERAVDPARCDIRFGMDPIGAAAAWGGCPYPWTDIAPAVAGAAKALARQGFEGPFVVADGRIVHDAGGSEAQGLAFVLASLVAYLRALEAGGIEPDAARGMVYARLSADADQFLTLAKFRALRLLWARVEERCGLAPMPLFVAAETAWRMLTQRDPYVNMLRATIACFSAALGGANSITVLPHTLALGLPDGFARRAARNTQLVLLEESNLARVSDPAAGSGGVETLTRELCASAWALFQAIEKAGGAFAALEHNVLQPHVARTREARAANIAKRRDIITGASEFPNLHEAPAEVLTAQPVALQSYGENTITFEPLEPIRVALPYEALRDRSDALLAAKGARPRVLLATLGTPADFTARATFAKSFFEAGGIEAVDHDGGDLAAAFRAAGAQIACLCSSDTVYAEQADAAARALREAGCTQVYLAGRGGDLEATLRKAGVGGFIYAGCDALAALTGAWQAIAP